MARKICDARDCVRFHRPREGDAVHLAKEGLGEQQASDCQRWGPNRVNPDALDPGRRASLGMDLPISLPRGSYACMLPLGRPSRSHKRTCSAICATTLQKKRRNVAVSDTEEPHVWSVNAPESGCGGGWLFCYEPKKNHAGGKGGGCPPNSTEGPGAQ